MARVGYTDPTFSKGAFLRPADLNQLVTNLQTSLTEKLHGAQIGTYPYMAAGFIQTDVTSGGAFNRKVDTVALSAGVKANFNDCSSCIFVATPIGKKTSTSYNPDTQVDGVMCYAYWDESDEVGVEWHNIPQADIDSVSSVYYFAHFLMVGAGSRTSTLNSWTDLTSGGDPAAHFDQCDPTGLEVEQWLEDLQGCHGYLRKTQFYGAVIDADSPGTWIDSSDGVFDLTIQHGLRTPTTSGSPGANLEDAVLDYDNATTDVDFFAWTGGLAPVVAAPSGNAWRDNDIALTLDPSGMVSDQTTGPIPVIGSTDRSTALPGTTNVDYYWFALGRAS